MTESNLEVAIICGSGDGRTGIAIASTRMRYSGLAGFVIALVVVVGASRHAGAEPWDQLLHRMQRPSPEITAFLHVNVIPMDSVRVVWDQTVIVRNGRIEALGPSREIAVPEGAHRIEGRGKYLIPGLVDMHFHMPGSSDTVNTDRYLALLVANGVTTVRCTLGAPRHPRIRDDVRDGRRFGPTLYVASRPLSGTEVKSPEQAHELVRRYRSEGFDFIKLYDINDSTVYDAAVEAARREGMSYFGHVSNVLGIEKALRARQGIEHLDGYLTAERTASPDLARLVRETREAGIWNCPTQFYCECVYTRDLAWLQSREGVSIVPGAMRREWVASKTADFAKTVDRRQGDSLELFERRRVVRALADGGAGLLLGSDTPGRFRLPGFALMEEVRAFRKAGLSPSAILAAGTRNAAAALGGSGEFGTVSVRKRADLVLLDGDPLQDIENLGRRAGVMLRGVWFRGSELEMLARESARGFKD